MLISINQLIFTDVYCFDRILISFSPHPLMYTLLVSICLKSTRVSFAL